MRCVDLPNPLNRVDRCVSLCLIGELRVSWMLAAVEDADGSVLLYGACSVASRWSEDMPCDMMAAPVAATNTWT